MTMRTFVGLCAALAFGLGSTAVHALKFVQSSGENPATAAGASATVTYAKETLLKGTGNVTAASDSTDKTMYYNIVRNHFLSAPPGVASQAGDTYTITYTLTGMVFAAVPSSPPTGFTLAAGGAAGDMKAMYRADAATAVSATTALELTATFAVSADGGSVTMEAENRTFGGMKGHDPAMIKVMSALKATPMPADPAPQAKAEGGFMNFGGTVGAPMLRASLGTFEVGVVTPNLEDAQGADNTVDDVNSLDDVTVVAANADGSVANPVTFSVEGGFGFVKTLALVDNATPPGAQQCTGTLTDIRKPVPATTPATYTDETTPQEAQTFELDIDADGTDNNMLQHLCVEVDGERPIPETGPFKVMAEYKGLADAAFPPMAMMHDLAMIDRDGASFRIPFLTTNTDLYKQLVIIVNHGSEADYSFGGFHAQAGTASAGMMASGKLPTGQTVLRSTDIVTIDGGNRAAATLSVVTDQSNISVAVQQIRAGTGQADTVYVD